jgi:hypothetical protein
MAMVQMGIVSVDGGGGTVWRPNCSRVMFTVLRTGKNCCWERVTSRGGCLRSCGKGLRRFPHHSNEAQFA